MLTKEDNFGSLKTTATFESLNLELWLYKEFIRHRGKIVLLKNYLENLLCFASIFLKVRSCIGLRKMGLTSIRMSTLPEIMK